MFSVPFYESDPPPKLTSARGLTDSGKAKSQDKYALSIAEVRSLIGRNSNTAGALRFLSEGRFPIPSTFDGFFSWHHAWT